MQDIVGSAFEQIVADELLKVKHNEAFQGQDGHDVNTKQDGEDMLWEYDGPDATAELGDEEYEALMLAMEHALYEDLHSERVGRGTGYSLMRSFVKSMTSTESEASSFYFRVYNPMPVSSSGARHNNTCLTLFS